MKEKNKEELIKVTVDFALIFSLLYLQSFLTVQYTTILYTFPFSSFLPNHYKNTL